MSISNINKIKTFANKLNADDNSILTIYENNGLTIGSELIPNHEIISFNCFVKNLRAFALIKSLSEIALPDFELTDSETDKLYKTLDVEWGSARKQLTLYISNQAQTSSSGQGWFKVGSLSLLNPSGYPYRIYNLMDLFTDNLAIELGDNGKIGIQVEDVGFGLLSAIDEVTIHGSYVEEIFVKAPDPSYVNIINSSGNGTTPTVPPPIVEFPINSLFRVSASNIQLLDNQVVTTWQQSSTSDLIVSQDVEGFRPTYRTNQLNGKSAVYFDGIDDSLAIQKVDTTPLQLLPVNSDWLIFLVASFVDNATYAISICGTDLYAVPNISIGGNRIVQSYFDEYGNYRELYYNYATTDWNIYVISSINGAINTYVNGTRYEGTYENYYPNYDPSYEGKAFIGFGNTANSLLNGYVTDFGIASTHTIADINRLGTYYKNLYNLNWTNI